MINRVQNGSELNASFPCGKSNLVIGLDLSCPYSLIKPVNRNLTALAVLDNTKVVLGAV